MNNEEVVVGKGGESMGEEDVFRFERIESGEGYGGEVEVEWIYVCVDG